MKSEENKSKIKPIKQIVTYMALGLYAVLILFLLFYIENIQGLFFSQAPYGLFVIVYVYYIFPLAVATYGILSFKLVKKIVSPHILFGVCLMIGGVIFATEKSTDTFGGAILLSIVMVAASLGSLGLLKLLKRILNKRGNW